MNQKWPPTFLAWGRISGLTGGLLYSSGISNTARNSVGNYTITFRVSSRSLETSGLYRLIVETRQAPPPVDRRVSTTAQDATDPLTYNVIIYDGAGAPADTSFRFYLLALG